MKYTLYTQTFKRDSGLLHEIYDELASDATNCPNDIYFAVTVLLGNAILKLQEQRRSGEIDFWYTELRATDEDGFRYRLAQIDSVDLEL